MHNWRWTTALSLAITLICLIVLTVLPAGWAERVPFAAAAAIFGYASCRLLQRQARELTELRMKQRMHQQQADFESHLIRILSHTRHDWLNELQLLYGYIQLKKYDNLKAAVEKIKVKAQKESNISKLGVSSLVAFLLSFGTSGKAMTLEVEMPEEINLRELPVCSDKLADFIRRMIGAFDQAAEIPSDDSNRLGIEIALQEGELLLDFIFEGSCKAEALQEETTRILSEYAEYIQPEECEYDETRALVAVRAPFQAK